MLKKLKSVLKTHKGSLLALACKAAIFSGLLYFSDNYWLAMAGFLAAALYFYFQSLLNIRQFLASFLVLLVISLIVMSKLPIADYQLPIAGFFGFLFFLLLGIKNLIFINRQPLYHFLSGLLLLTIFICFFVIGNKASSLIFIFKYLAAFSAVFLLLKEFLTVSGQQLAVSSHLGSQKINLFSAGLSFALIQFLWAINFLPLGFLNSAALILLIALILQDFVIHYFSGTISRQLILKNITVFLILSLIIFGAADWSP